MGWKTEKLRTFEKGFFAGEDKPLCIIKGETESGIFGINIARLTVSEEDWKEMGKVMGWKQ